MQAARMATRSPCKCPADPEPKISL
jgi:hypothetical protein